VRLARLLFVACLCATAIGGGAPLHAQGRPEIDIRVGPTMFPPAIGVRGVLDEQPFDEFLRNGFPARLHVRAESWTVGRYFDDVADRAEWDVIIRFDVIDKSYEVGRLQAGRLTPLGRYRRFAEGVV